MYFTRKTICNIALFCIITSKLEQKQEESELLNSELCSPITTYHTTTYPYLQKKKQACAHKQVLKTQSIKLCLRILNEIKEFNVAEGMFERCPETFTGMSTQ